MTGVNALNGQYPFLPYFNLAKANPKITLCQCPERATSISTEIERKRKALVALCQCPERATSISTFAMDICQQSARWCQCPERATSISTTLV